MFGHPSRWLARASTLLLPLMLVPLVGHGEPPSPKCQMVHGSYTLEIFSGPACPSPVDVCARGTYRGVLSGTSLYIGSSVEPTLTTPATNVILQTGDTTLQTRKGTLMTSDTTVAKTTGNGEFAEVDVIIGGTGAYAGATGTITASGTVINNVVEGVYSGELCTP